MHKRTGGCLCGAVRFEALGEPELIHACHCKNCQLMSGSAFFLVAYYVDHNVDITTGELTKFNRSCDSGRGITIYFCKKCGSTILVEPEIAPGKRGLAGGNFDDTSWIKNPNNIYCKSKQNWVEITKGPLNKITEYDSEDFN